MSSCKDESNQLFESYDRFVIDPPLPFFKKNLIKIKIES